VENIFQVLSISVSKGKKVPLMRKKLLFRMIAMLFFLGITIVQAEAQKKQYLNISGGAGYSSLDHGIPKTKISGGIGYTLGVGYEVHLDQFMFLTGVEFNFLNSKTSLTDYQENYDFLYPYIPDHYITYNYAFDNYEEKNSFGYLNIPLQAGMRFGRYYALTGVRFGFNITGNYKTMAQLQTTATDPMFVDDMSDMPNHYLESAYYVKKGDLDLGLNIASGMEFGVVLDEWLDKRFMQIKNRRNTSLSYRTGIFVDYGMVNINKATTDKPILSVPEDISLAVTDPGAGNSVNIGINSLNSSVLAEGKSFGTLFVGAKLTVLFDVTKTKKKTLPKPIPLPDLILDKEPLIDPEPELEIIDVPVFSVQVTDKETGEYLSADVKFSSVPGYKLLFEGNTNAANGMLSHVLKNGNYQVHVSTEGYVYFLDIFSHQNSDTIQVALKPIRKDVKEILRTIYFELNSDVIRSDSQAPLDELYHFLVLNPDVKIAIVGHTDITGTNEHNQRLSEGRAKAVHDVLLEKGINPSRLSWVGKGTSEPIAPNDSEQNRAKNRRVEFIIQ